MRSLRTWLALGLVLALAAPAGAAAGAYAAARAWQGHRRQARVAAAERLLARAATTKDLGQRLSALGVEAALKPLPDGKALAVKLGGAPVEKDGGPLVTPGLQAVLQNGNPSPDYTTQDIRLPNAAGTLYVRNGSAAARWAVALGAAVVALAAALALAVSLLRRWVLNPLATLAAHADRIAGGELAVAPVRTRAREVAQVGEALHGMAGALGQALGASADAERDRRFLVTAIAHDLRTPLFTLRGSLEAIERGIGDAAALARAQAKAAHLDRLVGDLFAYSRAEYANGARGAEPLDLGEIARRAVESVDAGPVELTLVAGAPAPCTGDPVALERALTNVVENAVRHARARVEVRVDGGGVAVVDDGPGFAPEDLPHVFEPLFRGDRARRANGAGAGLGLAIARRLARASGGDVTAANRPEGGAVVTLASAPAPGAPPGNGAGPPRTATR
jgi:signal transduction histidine kinase